MENQNPEVKTTTEEEPQFCPNCGSILGKTTLKGDEYWECPEGDYLYPVE